jgi:hypothetical protein
MGISRISSIPKKWENKLLGEKICFALRKSERAPNSKVCVYANQRQKSVQLFSFEFH